MTNTVKKLGQFIIGLVNIHYQPVSLEKYKQTEYNAADFMFSHSYQVYK